MIYQNWYQGSWWLFALFTALCAAILWRWTAKMRWPWQLLLIGTPVIAFGFPSKVVAEFEYWAPAFIQFGFELVDSGFSISAAWPLYQNAVLAMIVWCLLSIVALIVVTKRETAVPSTSQAKASKKPARPIMRR